VPSSALLPLLTCSVAAAVRLCCVCVQTLRARLAAEAEEKDAQLLMLKWKQHHKALIAFFRCVPGKTVQASVAVFYNIQYYIPRDVPIGVPNYVSFIFYFFIFFFEPRPGQPGSEGLVMP